MAEFGTSAANLAQHTRHTRIGRSEDEVGFAPFKGSRVCQSRAGRWREAHEWDGSGVCVFCDHAAIQFG